MKLTDYEYRILHKFEDGRRFDESAIRATTLRLENRGYLGRLGGGITTAGIEALRDFEFNAAMKGK